MAACARLRVHADWDVETSSTAATLRSLARRSRELTAEAADHRQAILGLVRAWRPDLRTQTGVGPIVAATVLCAWSHAGRCRSDTAFAMLGWAAPIPASSGQTIRVRLNRSGDRQLNQALYTVVLTRLRTDPAPAPTPNNDGPRARPTAKSDAAWSATSPASSTAPRDQPSTSHRESVQADLREAHRTMVTFCSRAVRCISAKTSGAAAK